METTLLKNVQGSTVRFYLDTSKTVIDDELGRLEKRGWVEEPPDLVNMPTQCIGWEGQTPVEIPPTTEFQISKRRSQYPPVGDQLDAIMKWLATETEFTVPKELKSIAMKCMSVKAQNPIKD